MNTAALISAILALYNLVTGDLLGVTVMLILLGIARALA